jgi:hypothetical protein
MHTAAMISTPKTIRVSVPVTSEVLEKFQRFSEVSGLSVSKSMGDWLRDTMAGLDAMTDILETHKQAPARAISKLQGLTSALQTVSDEAVESMKRRPSPLGEGAPLAGKSLAVAKAAISKAATSPRLVIRGGNSPQKGKKV